MFRPGAAAVRSSSRRASCSNVGVTHRPAPRLLTATLRRARFTTALACLARAPGDPLGPLHEADVRTHRAHAGEALGLEELLATGWPGERVRDNAGANRVHVAPPPCAGSGCARSSSAASTATR